MVHGFRAQRNIPLRFALPPPFEGGLGECSYQRHDGRTLCSPAGTTFAFICEICVRINTSTPIVCNSFKKSHLAQGEMAFYHTRFTPLWELYDQSLNLAERYSRFIRAIFVTEICFGHSTSHALVFVQFPNPSSSILATMALARRAASTLPCGSKAS